MVDAMTVTHLENLDRRLARVEQFLPTLATKDELQLAVAPLATTEKLQRLAETLDARTADLRRKICDEGERSRRHMDVLVEAQRADIQLLAGHLSVVMSKLSDR